MKQNISKEMWDELSDEQAIKMFEWVEEHYPDSRSTGFCKVKGKKTSVWDYAHLDIGQMIEFLEDGWVRKVMEITYPNLDWISAEIEVLDVWLRNEQLADALWEACKEKLKIV